MSEETYTPKDVTIHTDMSPTIGKLAAALAAAQGEITGAKKDSENPFYKSSYADLASCLEAGRLPLSKNKLAVMQLPQESPDLVKVVTMLAHESGEWVRSVLTLKPAKSDPQGIGSALTYARRYAFTAMVGIAQIDDDANEASGQSEKNKHDPKGDGYKQVDFKSRDAYANNFMTALHADKEEPEIADNLYGIHLELLEKGADMYNAVWSQIGSKDRKAIKEFIEIAKARAAA